MMRYRIDVMEALFVVERIFMGVSMRENMLVGVVSVDSQVKVKT